MTLYWPNNIPEIDQPRPRLHVFIIGVGDYPHLVGGAGHPAVSSFGLQQLTTTVITAKRIAEWFLTKYRNPAVPLGSIELLLSPAELVTRPDGVSRAIDTATMSNIREAFTDAWWPRCNSMKENVAVFYFAGHGLNTLSQYLLPADFGAPGPNLWANNLDFDAMRIGMRANAADTQLFFADACRETPIDALIQLNPTGDALATASLFNQVGASAAYYAAAQGRRAYGPSNDVTFFASALIDALDGAGALNKGSGQWVVDTFSLGNALGQIMKSLATVHGLALTCNPDPTGLPAEIHRPASGIVRTSIGCRTPQANAEAEIMLTRGATSHVSPTGALRPWSCNVFPGDWALDLKFRTFAQIHQDETLMPPLFELQVPV